MSTVFAEKFRVAGVSQHEVRFYVALSEFLNKGGSVERAHALIDEAAKRMGSEGQNRLSSNGRPPAADTSRTHDRAGPQSLADKAQAAMPRPVSHIYLTAARKGAQHIALTVLDSFKVRDGRAIGDLPWSGLNRLIGMNTREASVLRMVRDNIGGMPADPNTPLRDLIEAEELERIIQKAAELQDAH
jgi:hypothetical protein